MGLIGGSLALALRALETPPEVICVDPDPKTRKRALTDGVCSLALAPDDPRVDGVLAKDEADLVVLATPPAAIPSFLERIEAAGFSGVVTDVASTKSEICRFASRRLTRPGLFVPGHPMAGSEASGMDFASAGLFVGKYWVLCPDDSTDERSYMELHSLLTSIGARCIAVDRGEHDGMVATISHVPHLAASALVELASTRSAPGGELFRLASGGFRDSTRIASGAAGLWTDILMGNAVEVAPRLREMAVLLERLATSLEEGDAETFRRFLDRTSAVRRSLPIAWLPESDRLVAVRVSMSDGVGVVAGVTSAAGSCGCNIQSIGIEHVDDESAILELVLTDEGSLEGFLAQLAEEGFSVVGEPTEVHV